LHGQTARFGVAVAVLFGSAFILGYGGGAALGRTRQGVLAHLAGGVLAALNGGLLVALLLADVEHYLPPWNELDDGTVSRYLLRETDRLLLGAGALVAVWVFLGVIVTTVRHRRQPREFSPIAAAAMPPRQRPARLPREADAGKYEPAGSGFRGGRTGLDQTAPLLDPPAGPSRRNGTDRDEPWRRPVGSPSASSPMGGTGSGRGSANGHASPPVSEDTWLRRAAAMTRPTEFDAPPDPRPESRPSPVVGPEASWRFGGQGAGDPPSAFPGAGRGSGSRNTERDAWARICPSCGASVGATDSFCAECGRTV
jgi:hypothetical protein